MTANASVARSASAVTLRVSSAIALARIGSSAAACARARSTAPADDHVEFGGRQHAFDEPPAESARSADDQNIPPHLPGAVRSPVRNRPAMSGRGAMHVSVRPNQR
jgi:hypothetical protein